MKKILFLFTVCLFNCQSVQKANTAVEALLAMHRGDFQTAREEFVAWIPKSEIREIKNHKSYLLYMIL